MVLGEKHGTNYLPYTTKRLQEDGGHSCGFTTGVFQNQ